eukprot:GFUD01111944.1.p1 GENE.GFUD01111944.1~~GFUD01111944.1.p1  ORF type:complete len:531 (+),score=100.58 GFUD01111944.1:121-1713(+)
MAGITTQLCGLLCCFISGMASKEDACKRPSGFSVSPSSCSQYFYCDSLGESQEGECEEGKFWNKDIEVCDLEENVPCGKGFSWHLKRGSSFIKAGLNLLTTAYRVIDNLLDPTLPDAKPEADPAAEPELDPEVEPEVKPEVEPGTKPDSELELEEKDRKLSKVRVHKCEQYTDCNQCSGTEDPYCGWCSLEHECSSRGDCRDAAKDPLNWISYKSGRCTTITSVTPAELPRTTARTLQIIIENLPSLPGKFLCAFAELGKVLKTNATRTSTGVICTTPRNDFLPLIPSGKSHFTSKLSVRAENGLDFVATNFTFFDCNTYSSCTTCVSSLFPCDWCIDGHRCTHDTAENCRNDILVTGLNRIGIGLSIRSGPAFCPRINATPGGSPEILVSSGLQKIIEVKVDHIAQFIIQTRFVCQFNIEGRGTSVNAQLLRDTIYCDEMEFTYTSRAPSITATFAIIWGQSKPLDNPDNIHVLIYRCKEMVNNCGMCLSLDEKYQCGWCQVSETCEVKEQCGISDHISWLKPDQTCPA